MTQNTAELIAETRLANLVHRNIPVFLRPQTIEDGYNLQTDVHNLITPHKGPIVGFKIGCTTKIMQKFLNIKFPCAGCFFSSEVFQHNTSLKLSDFTRVGIECELAIQLNKNITDISAPAHPDQLIKAIKNIAVAIEIVENRYENFHSFGVPSLIADDFFAAGMVLGPPLPEWQTNDFKNLRAVIRLNGHEIGRSLEVNDPYHPFTALNWLANLKNKQGQPLCADHYILTGSLAETQWIDFPGTIECEIKGIGSVFIEFN